jgi:antagonist of KipI
MLEVLDGGMHSTVQDVGRYGYQRFGVPVSGAMGVFALKAANALIGNPVGAACVEMTVLGATVRFVSDAWFAITGGDLSPALDGVTVPMWESVRVASGSMLSFAGPVDGMRAYLAVAGGIDVPFIMGSRSTYLMGGFGGFRGRRLVAGDVLNAFESEVPNYWHRSLSAVGEVPTYGHDHLVRVVLGPQDDRFTESGIETLLTSEYTVSMQSDRMGYRLDGPPIEHLRGADIVSDGTASGSVQVPGNGQPIVLLADRGITGGYTKIATVISTDLGRFAQAMPGDSIRFAKVSVNEAHAALRDQVALLAAIERGPRAELRVTVNGEVYEVTDSRGDPIIVPYAGSSVSSVWTRTVEVTSDGGSARFDVSVERRLRQEQV